MARRKRSFSGTPAEHRREAGKRLKTARGALEDARHLLSRGGTCWGVLDALRIADRAQARGLEEKAWMGRRPSSDGMWAYPKSASSKAMMLAWRKFANKCLKVRR
jgi:hypothetical protein